MVLIELGEMKQQIRRDASDKRWWDYRELANTHSARHRLICVLGMAVFGQISGNSVTSYYLVVMLVRNFPPAIAISRMADVFLI